MSWEIHRTGVFIYKVKYYSEISNYISSIYKDFSLFETNVAQFAGIFNFQTFSSSVTVQELGVVLEVIGSNTLAKIVSRASNLMKLLYVNSLITLMTDFLCEDCLEVQTGQL